MKESISNHKSQRNMEAFDGFDPRYMSADIVQLNLIQNEFNSEELFSSMIISYTPPPAPRLK